MPAFRREYEIAIEFLRSKGHKVSDYSLTTHQCCIDEITVSDLGIIVIAQTYRQEWMEYLTNARLCEIELGNPKKIEN